MRSTAFLALLISAPLFPFCPLQALLLNIADDVRQPHPSSSRRRKLEARHQSPIHACARAYAGLVEPLSLLWTGRCYQSLFPPPPFPFEADDCVVLVPLSQSQHSWITSLSFGRWSKGFRQSLRPCPGRSPAWHVHLGRSRTYLTYCQDSTVPLLT
ncbi:uncharacterized protein CC84DRAFT_408697 [Paraphaeosphaeria sporulosa]|uniref:Secreted protein n=1 Tax=Paraphaeosphaeria sporulosa TaxID=1460663 RepID=A0A177BTY5_9PLEO|nr:uncharacterized protein CC84DRAFT_408697 [Paraphaeosphaeria sporulosa]OAF98872.1 hypothetical protein CC84DRAFT_408697 [Paraphaeosphaeria sporulosa]